MKRSILFILFTLIILGVLIACFINKLSITISQFTYAIGYKKAIDLEPLTDGEIVLYKEQIKVLTSAGAKALIYTIFIFIACLADIMLIILTVIKDFPVFKPLLDKHNARKQQRTQAKAERAEENKQKRIKQLEYELEELKKDE